MMSMGCVLGMLGCEDRMDSPAPSAGEGKPVEVTLCVGIADEKDGSVPGGNSADTRTAGGTGFDVRSITTGGTKSITVPEDPLANAKPDQLYGLEIWQYNAESVFQSGKGGSFTTPQTIGSSFTVTLTAMEDCQLLIIARGHNGSDYTVSSLSGKSLSDVQGTTASASAIQGITTAEGIKAMPYILHLPHVKVTSEGKIQSPDGMDIRFLLRRLATRLTLAWENIPANTGYNLKQVLLRGIPSEYKLLPDNLSSYPSLFAQYATIEVPGVSDKGEYTCWTPSVVRGESPSATSDYSRTKASAPKGSAYATFISQSDADNKQKLDYRVYLGGHSSHDFNLRENTNYIYKVTMSHTSPPVDDKRVTIIDPILASENNSNLVPTANCFMVAPGGAFCFNPYTYYVNGAPGENTLLQGWCGGASGPTRIKSVKVLWQTLEDGDLGDPVLGVVNNYAPGTDADDHTNIVEVKNGDSFTDACIYCRVAPNTTGGSGVIAAYDDVDGKGNILWSWHVWVTDYSPSPIGAETVLEPETKRKQVYKLNGQSRYPMMDRNLGAVAGYVTVPKEEVDRSKANGLMYQWGRKDPYRNSYTSEFIPKVSFSSSLIDAPMKGILSCYRGDGFTFSTLTLNDGKADGYQQAYQNPEVLYKPGNDNYNWINNRNNDYLNAWGQNGDKGLHDPCPAGWRVCSKEDFYPLYSEVNGNGTLFSIEGNSPQTDGGHLVSYNEDNRKQATYFRLTGYWKARAFDSIGGLGFFWTRDNKTTPAYGTGRGGYPLRLRSGSKVWEMGEGGVEQEALLIRCIQERAN